MSNTPYAGGCLCGAIRYQLTAEPMIVHACHCQRCQKRTGSPYAVNAWIEEHHVEVTQGQPRCATVPGFEGGAPNEYWHCTECTATVWTVYTSSPKGSRFIPAGTLDDPAAVSPDVHIFTDSKRPWVAIPDDLPSFSGFYRFKEVWPDASRARLRTLIEAMAD
ncbi:MAG: GFA family protein [Pseudomonadota bacterium]